MSKDCPAYLGPPAPRPRRRRIRLHTPPDSLPLCLRPCRRQTRRHSPPDSGPRHPRPLRRHCSRHRIRRSIPRCRSRLLSRNSGPSRHHTRHRIRHHTRPGTSRRYSPFGRRGIHRRTRRHSPRSAQFRVQVHLIGTGGCGLSEHRALLPPAFEFLRHTWGTSRFCRLRRAGAARSCSTWQ